MDKGEWKGINDVYFVWWNERDLIFEIFKITFIRNMRKNKLYENCYWIWIKDIKLTILVYRRVCSVRRSKCWQQNISSIEMLIHR